MIVKFGKGVPGYSCGAASSSGEIFVLREGGRASGESCLVPRETFVHEYGENSLILQW
jgi:hypothetical protein